MPLIKSGFFVLKYMTDLPGQSQVSGAAQTGQNAINNFDPTSTANTLNSGFNQLASQQLGSTGPQNASGYLNAYTDQVAKNPNVQSLYSTANQNFGVPQLASRANYLNTQVTNEFPNAVNQARGFDYNQGQIDNKVNQDLRFLSPQATAATNESQTAQTLAGQQVQAGITQNNMNLLPIQAYQSTMNQALAAQATGYTQDARQQFEGLQAKMSQGVALSTSEMDNYTKLAAAKESYDAEIAKASATVQASQNQVLGQGSTAVNMATGQAYNPFAAPTQKPIQYG